MSVVKKQCMMHIFSFVLIALMHDAIHAWPSNTRNDPFPMYTTLDPQYFLYEREKQLMFGFADEKGSPEYFMLSLSPFGQNANYAKTIAGTYCRDQRTNECAFNCNNIFCSNACTNPADPLNPTCTNQVEIGDIDGRWNLLGLLAGQLPQEIADLPLDEQLILLADRYPLWLNAFNAIFGALNPGQVTEKDIEFPSNNPCSPLYGYVSAPIKYRKRGIRWNLESHICGDWGFQFQGGIVEISQVLNPCLINLTDNSGTEGFSTVTCSGINIPRDTIKCQLFDPLIPLLRQLGLDICNFTKWGVEDLYFSLYWRHAYVVNYNRDLSWARVLAIPFFRIGVGAPTGRAKEQDKFFSVPFGNNNGSTSFNLNAGINFDFVETVEIGGEFGWSHFFSRDIDNYRVPTNFLQSSIFPWTAPITINPGDSAYVAFKLAAYHFLDRLSFYAQWVYVHHNKDNRTLRTTDPAFFDLDDNNPKAKCRNTAWRVQLGNFAFTYDISPNWAIGFLWQQMFHVRNAYQSTTALFTLNLIW
ncbi:MAG: hypothetical protein AMXMBFR12_09560 [Candidatus Babeliales bacterium]